MRKTAALVAFTAAAFAFNAPAQAQDMAGKVQVKVMGTAVLPDGNLKEVKFVSDDIAAALPAEFNTKADNNYVPTLAVEYFLTNDLSVETICCVTQHNVEGTGGLDGAKLVDDARIIPATLTAKYHLPLGLPIKPYIGAGATYWFVFNEKPGSTAKALGVADTDIKDGFGAVLQAGFDVPLNEKFGLTFDAKKYFIDRTASFYDANDTLVLKTKHDLDPWLLSAGISYAF
ncbi:outer membrane beta-barrel protein [Altererythrobacter indicus]|uniref:Outer membrane beta-barrel protein n=1 Tax=Altericroceibacterium indicum TaxID=374177 RepID=A0A845AA90_9SPHN|nr:OmpW family outer membrane protein [Altericroceibacterium indicum]MXP26604.1 outer membrane beta-barrel protein [Altericroceibacterium indicum]